MKKGKKGEKGEKVKKGKGEKGEKGKKRTQEQYGVSSSISRTVLEFDWLFREVRTQSYSLIY